MYDIIIVGAGPAGLTAALYALRANKKVLVLEAKNYGGQILNAATVENYPGVEKITGYEFATNLYNQVKKLGCEIKFETVTRVTEDKRVITNNGVYEAKAVIIATGVTNRKLNINGEEELIGKGVSYCASCDGSFYKGKIVAVNGGGSTALEDALYLCDIVKKLFIIHRNETFRGENKLLSDLKKKDNVEFILNSTIKKINGKDKLESIVVEDNEGNFNEIKVNGLFIAIGQEPRNQIFSNIVDINEYGYIESDDGVHTKVDGIYVAGDTRVKFLRQLTTAVSDGSIAATMAIKELK